jgi:xanthine dehydrogenase accessory factor
MNVLDVKLRQNSRGTIEVARGWLDNFGQVALATVVSTWGSAPVPIGGQLVVAPGSRFEGSVSGGCVEAEVITEAEDVMASDRPKLLEFGIAEETAWRAGLPCGGAIKIYVEPLRRERDGIYLEAVLAARLARTSLAVLTTLRTGARRLTHAAALDDEALRESLRASSLYIGALGSKKTHAKRLERLRAEGISEEGLARIRAPVGLSIGAKGPAEIAVSIIAEIVKTSRGGL